MPDKKPIQISGKNLAALAMPDACPRCFWIKNTVKNLPFQIFPGIFASIDSYTKTVVHSAFDHVGKAPAWLPELSEAVRYLKVPHWSKSKRIDPETGIIVTAVPDELLECADGSLIIPDYKTARYTDGQDKLLPLYRAQLNAYRWVWQGLGATVKSLPLIYCEPMTDAPVFAVAGFDLRFIPKTVLIDIDDNVVPELLRQAHRILTSGIPEKSNECGDCEKLSALVEKVR